LQAIDRRFTGQRWEASLGLYDYQARFYDPALGRFLQPDPLVQTDSKDPTPYLPLAVSYANPKVLEQWNQLQRARLPREAQAPNTPSAFDPQFLNRYAYARHNPLAYVDDSGHIAWWVVGGVVGGVVGLGAYVFTHRESFDWREAALWTAGGAVVGATLGAGAQWVAGAGRRSGSNRRYSSDDCRGRQPVHRLGSAPFCGWKRNGPGWNTLWPPSMNGTG
jgi:RHS repeat-associated protein